MARSTNTEAVETRRRILHAAEQILHVQGVARTSLGDIATAVRVPRGAIYWHFANKAELFNAMCERVRLTLEATVKNAQEGQHAQRGKADNGTRKADRLGQLRSACLFAIDAVVRDAHARTVFDILFHKCEFVALDDPVWQHQRECFADGSANILRLLERACASGQLPIDLDADLAAVTLHAMLDGLINNWLFAPERFALGLQAPRLIDACFASLRTVPHYRRVV